MFKKLKEKIKNITPKQAIVGALAGTAGIIISAPLAVAVGAGYLVKTIKDVKEENRIEQENLEKEKLMRSQITQEKIDEKLQVKLPTLDENSIPESFICPITQNIMMASKSRASSYTEVKAPRFGLTVALLLKLMLVCMVPVLPLAVRKAS